MRKVAIIGIGIEFYIAYDYLLQKYEITSLVDRNIYKQLWKINGIPIISYEDFKEKDQDYDLIMIAPSKQSAGLEIEAMLNKMGIAKDIIFLEECYEGKSNFKFLENPFCVTTCTQAKNYVSIYLKDESDWTVWNDIYLKNEYQVSIPNKSTLIDIGANIGIASLFFAEKDNIIEVHAFEPFPENYDRAKQNINNSALIFSTKINLNCFALSDYSGVKYCNYNAEWCGGNSIIEMKHGEEKITVKKAGSVLGKIVKEAKIKGNDVILKIDCEGSEYPIFDELEREHILGIPNTYIMEWHISRDKAEHLLFLLEKEGYRCVFTSNVAGTLGMIYAFK